MAESNSIELKVERSNGSREHVVFEKGENYITFRHTGIRKTRVLILKVLEINEDLFEIKFKDLEEDSKEYNLEYDKGSPRYTSDPINNAYRIDKLTSRQKWRFIYGVFGKQNPT